MLGHLHQYPRMAVWSFAHDTSGTGLLLVLTYAWWLKCYFSPMLGDLDVPSQTKSRGSWLCLRHQGFSPHFLVWEHLWLQQLDGYVEHPGLLSGSEPYGSTWIPNFDPCECHTQLFSFCFICTVSKIKRKLILIMQNYQKDLKNTWKWLRTISPIH